jgi:hypothetical protein
MNAADGDLQGLWQGQPPEGFRMSAEDVRRRADAFERTIEWRNAREYVAALIAAVCFGVIGWRTTDALVRASTILTVAGLACVVLHLRARGAARRPPAELGQTSGVEFLMRELARQRDLLRGVWRWYLAPPLPGMALYFAAVARTNPGAPRWALAFPAAAVLLVFAGIWWMNARAAAGLQRQIDEIGSSQA